MPTIDTIGPFRFFFYAGDRDEPAHVHVESSGRIAKYWLDPVRLQRSGGFSRKDLSRIQKILEQNQHRFIEAWNGYFHG